MDTPIQLILIGPSGAGKSSISKLLARRTNWDYHDEIGRNIYERLLQDNSIIAGLDISKESDLYISKEEAKRDSSSYYPRIIESWHPANFAYAQIRNNLSHLTRDPIYKNIEENIERSKKSTFIQPLSIDIETIKKRCNLGHGSSSTAEAIFYKKIFSITLKWCKHFNLRILPEVSTNSINTPMAAEKILENLIYE
ncbi:MAG: AAA family ATPase [bacterium]